MRKGERITMVRRLNLTHAQAFLDLSALAGSMGFNLRGAYPAKAVFVEQYYKPTVVQRASETIPRVVQGKPKTLFIGSDTMVRLSLTCSVPNTLMYCVILGLLRQA